MGKESGSSLTVVAVAPTFTGAWEHPRRSSASCVTLAPSGRLRMELALVLAEATRRPSWRISGSCGANGRLDRHPRQSPTLHMRGFDRSGRRSHSCTRVTDSGAKFGLHLAPDATRRNIFAPPREIGFRSGANEKSAKSPGIAIHRTP